MASDDLAMWLKRTARKGPFGLVKIKPISYSRGQRTFAGTAYMLVWQDKTKAKIGWIADGAMCRYGIDTYASLSGTTVAGLWQASNGRLTGDEIEALLAFAKDAGRYPEFDLGTLRDLIW